MVALLGLTAGACGGNEPKASARPHPVEPVENVIEIEATEYAYSVPDQIEGGATRLRLSNTGGLPHEFGFVQLTDDHTIDDFLKAMENRREPKWALDAVGVGVLGAGEEMDLIRDLDEGRYAFFCFLPTPDGAPHIAEGMVQEFEVAGVGGAEHPPADVTIAATDEGFEIPPMPAGLTIIEFANEGTKAHEFSLFALDEGKTINDVEKWFGSLYKKPVPGRFPGGIQAIEPGTSTMIALDLEEGRTYTLESFPSGLRGSFVPSEEN